MFSPLRNRFGIPGVISVIALVFAMFGGAYAASNSGDGEKASASAKKAKKGPRGPRGPKGPAGPFGPAGPQGPAGPAGPAGAKGDAGAPGAPGASGAKGATGATGVNGTAGAKGATGATGATGTTGTDGSAGTTGATGSQGSPWVVGTAPSGATLKGTWGVASHAAGAGETIPIAFSSSVPIPSGAASLAVYVPPGGPDPTGSLCPGSPSNPSVGGFGGIVCAYAEAATNLTPWDAFTEPPFQSTGGAVSLAKSTAAGAVSGYGSWALTIP